MRHWRELDEEELRNFEDDYYNMTSPQIMQKYGLCEASIAKVRKSLGLKAKPSFFYSATITPEIERYVINNFATTSNRELSIVSGLCASSIHRIARKHGIQKSAEAVRAHNIAISREVTAACRRVGIYVETAEFMVGEIARRKANGTYNGFKKGHKSCLSEEAKRRAAESRRKTVAKEIKRLKWGLEPRTKIKINLDPNKREKTMCRYTLRKHGYYVEQGSMDVFYDHNTMRSQLIEQRYVSKGFTFSEDVCD